MYTPLTEDLESYMIKNMNKLEDIHTEVIRKNSDERLNAVEQLMMVLRQVPRLKIPTIPFLDPRHDTASFRDLSSDRFLISAYR